jgi:hypothetical protein
VRKADRTKQGNQLTLSPIGWRKIAGGLRGHPFPFDFEDSWLSFCQLGMFGLFGNRSFSFCYAKEKKSRKEAKGIKGFFFHL